MREGENCVLTIEDIDSYNAIAKLLNAGNYPQVWGLSLGEVDRIVLNKGKIVYPTKNDIEKMNAEKVRHIVDAVKNDDVWSVATRQDGSVVTYPKQ